MTGPEHYLEAERLLNKAASWMNADTGWKAHMSTEERIAQRMADLAEAQVHATLADAAANALVDPARSTPRAASPDVKAWAAAAASPPDPLDEIA